MWSRTCRHETPGGTRPIAGEPASSNSRSSSTRLPPVGSSANAGARARSVRDKNETAGGSAFAARDRGEGVDPAASLASGQEPVADVADDRDDERHDQHDRTERVQCWAAVAAALLRVDVYRHRRVAGIGTQQVNQ